MEDFYEARNSIYCYKGTNVLKNKLEIKDFDVLLKLENRIAVVKSYELRRLGVTGNFDKEHFMQIHKFLFEDIYFFAGKLRTENIAKDDFTFASWQYIDEELDRILNEIKKENYLEGYSKEKLSKRLAYYLSELNVLHPFREGNGRVTREFIRQLALKNSFLFDLRKVSSEDFLEATKKSVVSIDDLEKVMFNCLEKI